MVAPPKKEETSTVEETLLKAAWYRDRVVPPDPDKYLHVLPWVIGQTRGSTMEPWPIGADNVPKVIPIPEIETETNTPTDNSNPSITTTETMIELVQVQHELKTDSNAANRDVYLYIRLPVNVVTNQGLNSARMTNTRTITASQEQQILHINGGTSGYYENDHGTCQYRTDDMGLPILCPAGTEITIAFTNRQTGDRGSMTIFKRVLEE